MYRRDWDDKRQEFRPHPFRDWTTHFADAAKYFALGHQERVAFAMPPRNLSRYV
jgi:hypothetical protein